MVRTSNSGARCPGFGSTTHLTGPHLQGSIPGMASGTGRALWVKWLQLPRKFRAPVASNSYFSKERTLDETGHTAG